MSVLTQCVAWLNALANLFGKWLLAPIGWLPGWLSATCVSIITGVLLLLMFKFTSDQQAIKGVRDSIKANLLALKLFKENTRAVFRSQGKVFWGAFRLAYHSIIPMLVMLVPVTLLMTQMSLWYQARPLQVGEDAVLTVKLNDANPDETEAIEALSKLNLEPSDCVKVMTGPVRVQSKREVCWLLRAIDTGYHELRFAIDEDFATKDLAIGNDLMRVSVLRPPWSWTDVLLYPGEQPFSPDSSFRSIEIDFPERTGWTTGTNNWVIYWFVVSMVAAFCVRPLINVNI